MQDAHEMWHRAVEAGVKTGIQFGHRVLPGLCRLRALLLEGVIGRPEYLECSWCFDWAREPSFPLTWRFRRDAAGAGALADLGVYAIDAARWLIGEFSGVVGHLETFVARRPVLAGRYHFDQVVQMVRESRLEPSLEAEPVENEDECTFLAIFECGAHGFFRASRVRAEQRLLVSGSHGELLWRLDEDRLWKRPGGQSAFIEIELPQKAHALTFVDSFVRDILRDTDLGPSFYDGLRAQAVMEAVLASAVDRRWTSIPLTDGAGPIGGKLDLVGPQDARSN
jgi:predicted dehydrogenase